MIKNIAICFVLFILVGCRNNLPNNQNDNKENKETTEKNPLPVKDSSLKNTTEVPTVLPERTPEVKNSSTSEPGGSLSPNVSPTAVVKSIVSNSETKPNSISSPAPIPSAVNAAISTPLPQIIYIGVNSPVVTVTPVPIKTNTPNIAVLPSASPTVIPLNPSNIYFNSLPCLKEGQEQVELKFKFLKRCVNGKWIFIAKGDRGIQGESGIKGKDGTQCWQLVGDKNQDGVLNLEDCRGKSGVIGDDGLAGDVGRIGDKGEQGEIGDKGEQGPIGEKGTKGIKGKTGIKGDRGLAGNVGNIGPIGETGLCKFIGGGRGGGS